MLDPRLYADHAATSFPKPPEVAEAVRAAVESVAASAGRGAYREAAAAERILADARRQCAALLNAERPESVAFTLNGTAALNLAIKGLLREGDHVVTTTLEHNSVLRPLATLARERRVVVTRVATDAAVRPADVAAALRPATRLIIVNHASNVTGTLQPVEAVGAAVRRHGAVFLVDAAQTAGHVPIDVRAMGIDLLAAPGHKGLLGPAGTGLLYVRPGVEAQVCPLIEGGTGSLSERLEQPDAMPDRLEAGTHNLVGVAGLAAGVAWVQRRSVTALRLHDVELSARFIEQTRGVPRLRVYGPTTPEQRVAVFSVRVEGLEPAEASALLESEFGILTRSGLHCAPLAHQTIGTLSDGGTTRFSFGPFHTLADVDRCTEALRHLACEGRAE